MPTTTTFAFGSGITATPGWGDRWVFNFGNFIPGLLVPAFWSFRDTWTLTGSFQSSPFVLGWGQVSSNGIPTNCFTYKERVYLAVGQFFNFCDNNDPTEWEQQGPGAGFVEFMSQLGGQDSVVTFGQLQGRLAVLASNSIQMWQTDADPANFALVQQLCSAGTTSKLSAQNQGDFDTMYLDATGIRSIRTMDVTLNAFLNDVGIPVDALVAARVAGYDTTQVCTVVDPATKNEWTYINGTIFVFARYPSAKVSAWSQYEPRGNDNVVFTPQKFVVFRNQVYCRSVEGNLYLYGAANNSTYDVHSQVTLQLPWLDDRRPNITKHATGIDFVTVGQWSVWASLTPQNLNPADPVTTNLGSAASPNELTDSSYSQFGRIAYEETGTHFSILAVSSSTSTTTPVKFCSVTLHYNAAGGV